MSDATPFWFQLTRTREDLNNGSSIFVGYLKVWAIGYTFSDGTYKSVDIDQIHFYYANEHESTDLYSYIKNLQPDVYEDLEKQAVKTFKAHLEYVTSQKSTPNRGDSERGI